MQFPESPRLFLIAGVACLAAVVGGCDSEGGEQPDDSPRSAVNSTEPVRDCEQRPSARSEAAISAQELEEYLSPEEIEELRMRLTKCGNLRQREAAYDKSLQYCKYEGSPAGVCLRLGRSRFKSRCDTLILDPKERSPTCVFETHTRAPSKTKLVIRSEVGSRN